MRSDEAPQEVVLANLPQITAAEMAAAGRRMVPAARTLASPQQWQSMKAEAAAASGGKSAIPVEAPAPPRSGPPADAETPSATVAFKGLGSGCGHLFPPDMALAVSQSWIVQVINGCVAVYDKTGVLQAGFPKSSNAFFGLGAGAFLFDIRALYDWVNNRFIVVEDRCQLSTCENSLTNVSHIEIAVSQTSDPHGAWNIYHLGLAPTLATGDFSDFPTLGQDRKAIYIGFNDFTHTGGLSDVVLYLPKSRLYARMPIGTFWISDGFMINDTPVDSIQPANVMNKADSPRAEFMVNTFNINFGGGGCTTGCNGLVLWAVSNPLYSPGTPGPEVSGVTIGTVNNYTIPPDAQQPGCSSGSCLIDTDDVRISGEVTYASGILYGAFSTNGTGGGAGTAHHIWFAVRPFLDDNNDAICSGSFVNKCPDIIGAQEINEVCFACTGFSNSTASSYYPAIQPDPEGNVTIVYDYSDDSTFPESVYQSNRVTQLSGTQHDAGRVLQAGAATYDMLVGEGLNRWGDYSAVAPDLTDPAHALSFWFAAQSAKSATAYQSAIGHNAYTSVTQP